MLTVREIWLNIFQHGRGPFGSLCMPRVSGQVKYGISLGIVEFNVPLDTV